MIGGEEYWSRGVCGEYTVKIMDNKTIKKRVGIDYDGVLIEWHGLDKPDIGFGKPKVDAVEAIKYLTNLGYECYILTARHKRDWPLIEEWLKKWGFPEMRVGNYKMTAVAYIDDRGIRFTNWKDMCRYFN